MEAFGVSRGWKALFCSLPFTFVFGNQTVKRPSAASTLESSLVAIDACKHVLLAKCHSMIEL
jgi:hypothetical protein